MTAKKVETIQLSAHALEYHLATNRSEALTLATKWMDAEHTMLSERRQTHEVTGVGFHLCQVSRTGVSTETESG